jgi:TPR repeat protein
LSYKNGKGVEVNYVKALQLFNKAGDVGVGQALFQSFVFYSKGLGVKRDLAKCYEKLKLSVEQDYIHAYSEFALFLLQTSNTEKAIEYLEFASKKHSISATFWLGYCLIEGIGVHNSTFRGINLFRDIWDPDSFILSLFLHELEQTKRRFY